MLKFDIRKQPNIPHLTDVLVDKLVEEANEVKEALYDNDINGNAYIQELLDVQQTLFAIFGNYKKNDMLYTIENAMEEHNKKLATSHKEKYGLGDIQYIGYVDLNKPGDDPTEKLESETSILEGQLKETQDKLRRVQDNCKARIESDRRRIQDLESKLDECDEDALREKDEEIEKLERELHSAESHISYLRCEYSKDNKKLREELQHKNTYIDDINKLNDRVMKENIDLKYKLSTETATGQNKKLEFLEKKYKLSMEANRQLREEIQTLRIENGEYRDIINRIENYINELKTQQMD